VKFSTYLSTLHTPDNVRTYSVHTLNFLFTCRLPSSVYTRIAELVYQLATRWMVWRSNPGTGIRFSFLQNIQTGTGAHPAPFSMGISVPPRGRGWGMSTTHLHLPLRPRMSGAIPLLPSYASMLWEGITSPFYFTTILNNGASVILLIVGKYCNKFNISIYQKLMFPTNPTALFMFFGSF